MNRLNMWEGSPTQGHTPQVPRVKTVMVSSSNWKVQEDTKNADR